MQDNTPIVDDIIPAQFGLLEEPEGEDKPFETPTVFNIFLETKFVYLKWEEFLDVVTCFERQDELGRKVSTNVLTDIYARTGGYVFLGWCCAYTNQVTVMQAFLWVC